MSKQCNDVISIVKIFYPDTKIEVPLENITKIKIHKGIRVDLYIPSVNLIVEVMGIQHEKAQSFGMNRMDAYNKFNMQLNRDSKLRQICKDFNINYEEIWYNEKVDFVYVYNKFKRYLEDGSM